MTKITNGMLHVPILCLSFVLVVIIVQHAVFLWHISFRISGGYLSMYNGFSGSEDMIIRYVVGGGRKGDKCDSTNNAGRVASVAVSASATTTAEASINNDEMVLKLDSGIVIVS